MKIETENNGSDQAGRWKLVDEYSYAEHPYEAIGIDIDTGANMKLKAIRERVDKNEEIKALWACSNVIAMNRLGYSDHGMKHVEIVAGISLKMLKLLDNAGIRPSCIRDYGLSYDDAEVILFLAACMHDIGHSIQRDNHTQYSVWLAMPLLGKLLDGIYPPRTLTFVTSEVLHCIAVHHKDCRPLSLEAGILRVSDALDMAHGRTRLWDDHASNSNIHTISAKAIESVDIVRGSSKPVAIKVTMSGSAGVFQIDELLRPKLRGSGIEDYVEVNVHVECEKSLVNDFSI